MEPLSRAIEFERSWLHAQATAIEPVEVDDQAVGQLLLTEHARSVRDHNAVVLHPHAPVDAASLTGVVDDRMAAHGFDHRRVYCATADDADRLRTGMSRRGYEIADTVVMRWPGGALAAADVDGVDLDEADAGLVERWTRAVSAARSHDVVEDFAALTARQHQLGVRFLVASVAGEPVGGARIYLGDAVAQVEELDVLAAHRGRGIARALLARALQVVATRDLVFLTSDPDDWPTAWYRRLGFQVVGRSTGFSRVPADAAA